MTPSCRTLNEAWARPATRHAFWAHFGLMGPFVAITALWGYPYLVQSQGLAPSTARAWLLACVVAFGAAAPLLGAIVVRAPESRTGLLLGITLAVTGGWAAALLWPGGHPPRALILVALVVTGVGGACAMLTFDLARAGNPAHIAGGATGLANTGGFSAAVVVAAGGGGAAQPGGREHPPRPAADARPAAGRLRPGGPLRGGGREGARGERRRRAGAGIATARPRPPARGGRGTVRG